jgi:beta-glucosidase
MAYNVRLIVLVLTSFWGLDVHAQISFGFDNEVEDLLDKMTLEEKVGQMTQITLEVVSKTKEDKGSLHTLEEAKLKQALIEYHVGSILNVWDASFHLEHWQRVIKDIQDIATKDTRLGIPIIYGIDAVHGHHFLRNATIFPHNLALAATWDIEHVKTSNKITALETRASGVPWNFSPVLDVARNPLWSRFFETFGEDTYLVTEMGRAATLGLQGDSTDSQPENVAATAKHFIGYSAPLTGKDRTPAWIPEGVLREYFLPPFRAAIDAGIKTIMVNSAEINGVPVHSSHALLTGLLRDELGFKGVVVTDWEDVIKLHKVHRVATSEKEAVKIAVLAGIDISMTPFTLTFYDHLVELVREGEISEDRIDESVRRILKLKFDMELFDNPYPNPELAAGVAQASSHKASLAAAQDAMTLLKNDQDLLPLSKQISILLTGPGAASLPPLYGGWSYTWQGVEESFYPQNTDNLLQAMRASLGENQVKYVPGVSYSESIDISAAVAAAKNVDVIVVAIAEKPAVEQPGIIENLDLPEAQLQLVKALQSTGKPVVLVLMENRPRIIREIEKNSQAIMMAYLPGMFGAEAIVDVLFGDVNPNGKLPFTYPRYSGSLENYDYKGSEQQTLAYTWTAYNPQWPFGYGLSYTTYKYSHLKLDKAEMYPDDVLNVSVTVTNTGKRAGKESIQLYVSDLFASVTPAVKKLRRFTKISLEPGESKTVEFELRKEDLSFIGRDNKPILEPGDFEIKVGKLKSGFVVKAAQANSFWGKLLGN